MSRMLILQLERFGPLSAQEKLALAGASVRPRRLILGAELPLEEERADLSKLLLAGFGCRYVVLPNGRRQILAYLLPGEFCDRCTNDTFFPDHGVCAISPVKIGWYRRAELDGLARRFPRIDRALRFCRDVEQAIQRQWLLNVGHRNALERTSHLLCELFTRMKCLGLVQDGACTVPLRQVDLADALAISAVHLNRSLMEIRRRRLAALLRHQLVVEDLAGLQALGGFHPQYLFAGQCASETSFSMGAEPGAFQPLQSSTPVSSATVIPGNGRGCQNPVSEMSDV